MREQLLDRMIRIYGFEHEVVIEFARMCESDNFTDRDLEVIVEAHEANPVGFDENEDFQKKGLTKGRSNDIMIIVNEREVINYERIEYK